MQSMPKAKEKITEKVLKKKYFKPAVIVGLILIILALVVLKNKGLFIAATVNGRPLWRLDLEKRLVSQYGSSTIDEIVAEMLIHQAASQKKVSVTKADVDAKLAEIEKSLNGQITLKEALAQQGDTIESLRQRVELQLLLEKLTAGQVIVSDSEVADYLDKNKTTLSATDEAEMRVEAKNILLSQKQNTVLRQYFTDLKSKAQISKFL